MRSVPPQGAQTFQDHLNKMMQTLGVKASIPQMPTMPTNAMPTPEELGASNFAPLMTQMKDPRSGYNTFTNVLGDIVERTGNANFRNNNFGNMRWSSWQKQFGGQRGANRDFTVFPTPEAGREALYHLLFNLRYKDLNIKQMVPKYAPKKDNNDEKQYTKFLMEGMGGNPVLGKLKEEDRQKFLDLIMTMEGIRNANAQSGVPSERIIGKATPMIGQADTFKLADMARALQAKAPTSSR